MNNTIDAMKMALALLNKVTGGLNIDKLLLFHVGRTLNEAIAREEALTSESAAVPEGWREFVENIAAPGSEPLNSLAGSTDKASRRHWLGVIRNVARDLLAAAPQPPAPSAKPLPLTKAQIEDVFTSTRYDEGVGTHETLVRAIEAVHNIKEPT